MVATRNGPLFLPIADATWYDVQPFGKIAGATEGSDELIDRGDWLGHGEYFSCCMKFVKAPRMNSNSPL